MDKTDEEGKKINSEDAVEQTNMTLTQINDDFLLVVETMVLNAPTGITSTATIDSRTDPNATVDEGTQTKQKKVLSIGICSVDIVHYVEKFPEDDIKVQILDSYWQRGGSASNVCSALHGLGVKTEFMGVLSTNPTFQFLIEDCQNHDIDIDNCSYTEQDPPFASVIMSRENGGRTTIHSEMAYPALSFEEFSKLKLDDYNWIHMEGRNTDETKKILKNIKQHNANADEKITTSVDLQQLDREALELAKDADVVTVGRDYAEYMGWENMKDALNGIQDSTGEKKPITLCYWDEKGAACLDSEGKYTYYAPIPPVEMVDSLGVHDAFMAGFIFANLNLGLNPKNSTSFGNRCASFKLGQRGYEGIEKFVQCSCCCHLTKENDTAKVAADNGAAFAAKNTAAPEDRLVPETKAIPEDRAAPEDRAVPEDKAVVEDRAVSEDRTVREDSAVSEDRAASKKDISISKAPPPAPIFDTSVLENQKPRDNEAPIYKPPPAIEESAPIYKPPPVIEKSAPIDKKPPAIVVSDKESASDSAEERASVKALAQKFETVTVSQKSILDEKREEELKAEKKDSVTVSQKSILDPIEKRDTASVASFMDPDKQRDTITVSQKSILDPVEKSDTDEKRDTAPATVKSFMDPDEKRDTITVSQKSILDPEVKKEEE